MPPNALVHEKSPYLRQHADNPVNWLPWSDAAFERARAENKPVFLSVGYSTCHWCHVMAHESFESSQIADILNDSFVSVKVDREERPDVDRIYMLYIQATSGSGGWPMSVWLTPDRKPFYGGTYFPPDSRYGRPGFADILKHIAQVWRNDRERVEASSNNITDQLKSYTVSNKGADNPNQSVLDLGFSHFRRSFDPRWGGFGAAPKFPRPATLNFLLRYYATTKESEALDMVVGTLRHMADGGMHDQLGGGFHRYSVDERWFVSHFEKMLYDQAQLAISYLEAFQITREPLFAETARGIFAYVARDLTSTDGGFYSAEDADSPDPENPSHSGEGAFYIWRQQEIESLLSPDKAALFCRYYGAEIAGNVEQDPHEEFTGRNILYRATPIAEIARRANLSEQEVETMLASARKVLLQRRSTRPRPHLDRKILTSWNSLMISALAKGYAVLGHEQYLRSAGSSLDFLLEKMFDSSNGQLLRRFCDGEAAVRGFLDDYAFLAQASIDIFEVTGAPRHLQLANTLAREMIKLFADGDEGAFFSTVSDSPDLILRMKDDHDGAEPSGNSVAADVLLRLAHLTGDQSFEAAAMQTLRWLGPRLKQQPSMAPQMLVAATRALAMPEQVIVRYETDQSIASEILSRHRKDFNPHLMVLGLSDAAASEVQQLAPALAAMERQSRVTVYQCRNLACELPENIP